VAVGCRPQVCFWRVMVEADAVRSDSLSCGSVSRVDADLARDRRYLERNARIRSNKHAVQSRRRVEVLWLIRHNAVRAGRARAPRQIVHRGTKRLGGTEFGGRRTACTSMGGVRHVEHLRTRPDQFRPPSPVHPRDPNERQHSSSRVLGLGGRAELWLGRGDGALPTVSLSAAYAIVHRDERFHPALEKRIWASSPRATLSLAATRQAARSCCGGMERCAGCAS
jgi:hypothetical protein